MTYFDDKPFILQIHHEGEWWVSDYFASVEAARLAARKKVNPWRVIRYSTGAVVSCGNPVWVHTTTSEDSELNIFEWNRWLHNASLMQLHTEVLIMETIIAFYAEIWEYAEGAQRDRAQEKLAMFDGLLHQATLEIEKRKHSQFVPRCEN